MTDLDLIISYRQDTLKILVSDRILLQKILVSGIFRMPQIGFQFDYVLLSRQHYHPYYFTN